MRAEAPMNPTKTLVTLGMKCPRPLFEVHKTMKGLTTGQMLEVVADDPAFRLDIAAWCRRTGNELLEMKHHEQQILATLRKTA
jgi:TusA-related sulfurtransferase